MNHEPDHPAMKHKMPVRVLSSFIIGLALAPLGYIAIGALGGFSAAFSMLSLPLLLGSMAFLLLRLLPETPGPKAGRRWWMVVEGVAWLLTGLFLLVVSGFTLLTTWERIGLFCVVVLAASVLAAPVAWWRPCALVARVGQWPPKLVLGWSVSCAGLLIGGAAFYVVSPSPFL